MLTDCILDKCTGIGTVMYRPQPILTPMLTPITMRSNLVSRSSALGLICPEHYLQFKSAKTRNALQYKL